MTAVDHGYVGWSFGQPRRPEAPKVEVSTTTGRADYQPRHPETVKLASRVYRDQTAAGRAYGAVKGYVGRAGGWIYNSKGRVITQGWSAIAFQHVAYDADARGYRFGANALRKLDEYLDRQAAA